MNTRIINSARWAKVFFVVYMLFMNIQLPGIQSGWFSETSQLPGQETFWQNVWGQFNGIAFFATGTSENSKQEGSAASNKEESEYPCYPNFGKRCLCLDFGSGYQYKRYQETYANQFRPELNPPPPRG